MSKKTRDFGVVKFTERKKKKTGRYVSLGKEMQITQTQSVEILHSKPLGVPVETRWCIGVVH